MSLEKPLPFLHQFREMSKPELRKYYQWFMNVLPEKVDELARLVHQTPGFETWDPNYAPTSLDRLGDWFCSQVETRNRTRAEISVIEKSLTFPIEIETWDLSDHTYAIVMDVGMYLSQVFLRNHASLRWEQPFGSRRFADFGQPSIAGFGPTHLNPMRVAGVLAFGFVKKTKTCGALRSTYEIWRDTIKENKA